MEPPEGYYGRIVSRSSSMGKKGLLIIEGTIDPMYSGDLTIQVLKMIYKDGQDDIIYKGEKIAQLVFAPVITPKITTVDKIENNDRGNLGFGSSGGYKNETG